MSPKRAIILANGKIANPAAARALLQPGDWIAAADGGGRHLASWGVTPHLLVGDLDSLSMREASRFERLGVKIERHPAEKDETDLELALRAAQAEGCTRVVIIGALGGRLDHTLGNLMLLQNPRFAEMDMRLDDGMEEVFIIHGRAEITGKAGDTISLLALSQPVEGIFTEGLRYRLRGERLSPGETRGISNVMEADTALVNHAGGALVCIHTRKVIKKGAKK
jgi:thiamine pyrophosphokinase